MRHWGRLHWNFQGQSMSAYCISLRSFRSASTTLANFTWTDAASTSSTIPDRARSSSVPG